MATHTINLSDEHRVSNAMNEIEYVIRDVKNGVTEINTKGVLMHILMDLDMKAVDSKPLSVGDLALLRMLATAVEAEQPITYLDELGHTRWGIARAFTHEDGGFLGDSEDVREGFVWLSGGTHFGEAFYPVQALVDGLREGRVALDYRP